MKKTNYLKLLRPPLWIGFLIYGILLVRIAPWPPGDISWVKALLVLAPLLFVPMSWRMTADGDRFGFALLGGGTAMGFAFILPVGYSAGLLAMSWLVMTLVLASKVCWRYREERKTSYVAWSHLAAFLYLPIGAAWAVADRLGISPLGFSPAIVLLTAVHFHYAGFLLPLISAKILNQGPIRVRGLLDGLVVLGVPLVAMGITITQLKGSILFETLSASIMALGGLGIAVLHIWRSGNQEERLICWFWRLGGLCLGAGMLLALAYGWRAFFPISFLSIPWMYAVHGTLNAVGVGVFLLTGWHYDGKAG